MREKYSISFYANLYEAFGPFFLNTSPTVLKNIMRDAGETHTLSLHWKGKGSNQCGHGATVREKKEKGKGKGKGKGKEKGKGKRKG